MRYLYFDLIGGISGDMIAAGLLDITQDLNYLKNELKKISLDGYSIDYAKRQSGHISAHNFSVKDLSKKKRVFQIDFIKNKVENSGLRQSVKKNIIDVYKTLYNAEKKVHGHNHAHFEQIGEMDSLIDIASACVLIDRLRVDEILYSRIPFGEKVAPATALLLKSKEVYLANHRFENITPTGIAIIATLGNQKKDNIRYNFSLEAVGYGIGSVEADSLKNVLRVVVFNKTKRKK